MGNALFQAAFAYAAGKRLGTQWYLSDITKLEYFELRPCRKIHHHLYRLAGRIRKVALNRLRLKDARVKRFAADAPPEDILTCLGDGLVLEGFFQSEEFFRKYHSEVKEMFSIRPFYLKKYNDAFVWREPTKRRLAIHVRRTDYTNTLWGHLGRVEDLSLPFNYYANSLRELGDLSDCEIIVLGDDLDWANEHFSHLPNVRIESYEAPIDFQIMMNADTIVISNSTFAWWAAYLNERRDRRVIAPQYWLGFRRGVDDPPKIIPEEWEKVSFSVDSVPA